MFQSQTKQCQNCKSDFIIEPEDFEFYQKISVPAPTFCPDCRTIRRMLLRNERALYKRKCDAPGHNEEIISIYHKDSPVKVYDQKYWWSDEWDAMDYGKDYDFSRPFFEQWGRLLKEVPFVSLVNTNSVNSDYCNSTLDSKNCYLIFAAMNCEDSYYSNNLTRCKNCFDLYILTDSELCYQSIFCEKLYKSVFCAYSENCIESMFLINCRNCSNCFGCVDLRNKSYHIFNKPYSKEEYFKKIQEFNLGSYKNFNKFINVFANEVLKYPHKYAKILNSSNVIGDNIRNSNNCYQCFLGLDSGMENCSYVVLSYGTIVKDSHSCYAIGKGAELCYESASVNSCNSISFSKKIWTGNNISYSYICYSSSNLFGCIGLRNKEYCILNKQYSKEEYEKLVPKIIEHMG